MVPFGCTFTCESVGLIPFQGTFIYLFIFLFPLFFVPAFFIPECASGFVWRGRKGSAAHLGVCIFFLFFDFESFCSVLFWISWYMVGMSWLLWTDSIFFFSLFWCSCCGKQISVVFQIWAEVERMLFWMINMLFPYLLGLAKYIQVDFSKIWRRLD